MNTEKGSCCPFSCSNPTVRNIVYWREPIKSGVVMAAGLSVLLSLACLSFISVVAYACLALLCCTAAWRIYHDFSGKKGDAAALKTDSTTNGTAEGNHPFQDWLSTDVTIPRERVSEFVTHAVDRTSRPINYFRRVLVVQSYLETATFAVYMYLLSILGGYFNLLTVVTFGFIMMFTIPKVYELYQPQIDRVLDKVRGNIKKVWDQAKKQLEKVPFLGKTKSN